MLQVLVQAYPVPGLARSMLASVALRTSIGSRRRSVPFQLQQEERLRLVPPMSKELEGGHAPFVNTLPRHRSDTTAP